ncbi:helix-turn-helix domain-containing protein [Alishewanella longhuensis]
MNDKFFKTLGRNICDKRKSNKLTQLSLSHETGVDPSYISRLERGIANASLDSLLKIAKALNCSVKDLIPDSNNPID